jgi:Fe-S cluster assembly protein SufD
MSAHIEPKDRYLADFARAERDLAGHGLPWLRSARREALSRFAAMGLPTTRDEDWKYTRVTPVEQGGFTLAPRPRGGLSADTLNALTFAGLGCHLLVFVNGYYAPELSSLHALPSGVRVGSLAAMLDATPGVLEPHLSRSMAAERNAFNALNAAFTADGAYVEIAAHTVMAQPIHLLFVSVPQDQASAAYPRNLIVAHENSQATVIESYVGIGNASYFSNAVTEVVVGRNAAVERYKLQQESTRAVHIAMLQVQQERDSRFASHCISLGGGLVRNDIAARLDGERVECTLNGLYLAGGRQHVDNHTRIDHTKPRGTSREFYKGVLDGMARGVFNGKVIVHQDAQQTDAQQTNKNLLLSEAAEVDTKPELEIYADDVKCAHGATVGQLDDNAVFYLQSRGVDAASARSLLIYAFANDIISRIRLAPVRARLEGLFASRLGRSSLAQEVVA